MDIKLSNSTELIQQEHEKSKDRPSSSNDDAEDKKVKKEIPKDTGRGGFGLGLLLQQMRNTNTVKAAILIKEPIAKVTEHIHCEKKTVRKKTLKPKSKIDYNFSTVDEKSPIQEVKNCFNSGTVPNFGFSKKVKENNYVRSCKWSPDGNWLIADSEDRKVRIFSYNGIEEKLNLHGSIRSGDLIYEVQWHPTEDLFASTSKDHPIHLWDLEGNRTLSFRGIDSADELASAFSMAFSLDGETLYAGYYKYIRIFNIERPGKQVKEIKTFDKGVIGGQKAILSCFSMCPTFAGSYAVGSFGGSIGLYSDRTNRCDCSFATSSPGITQIQYSLDGNLLFAGYRKSDSIECFDLRFPGMVLSTFNRPARTNQKIAFQLDSHDQYLFSGSSSGDILIFDLKQSQRITSIQDQSAAQPNWVVKASKASVSGFSLHPEDPIAAITCGQRVYPSPLQDSSSSECEELIDKEKDSYYFYSIKNGLDNSLKLWKF